MATSVYIPEATWLMMILTIVCICIFRTTTVLGNAYGLCVCAMMFITTIFVSLAFIMVYDVSPWLVAAFFVFFGFIDCVFLSANLVKVTRTFRTLQSAQSFYFKYMARGGEEVNRMLVSPSQWCSLD